jgi:mono/diheme cytochrome c family protein
MKKLTVGAIAASALAIGAIAYAQTMHSGPGNGPHSTMMQGGWHAGPMWSMGPGRQGRGPIARHHFAMMSGIPAPYASMTNPLPHTQAALDQGAKVYSDNCAACHGEQGQGDGPAGASLSPLPGNLAWLSEMPIGQWDPLIYWTVADGGSQFGSAMPAFKDSLSKDQIWAVTAYIQAHLLQKSN